MMIAIVLIAIAAGCTSALMFASIISGALTSLLLFYLAPLPLMVAALGWGPLSATLGGIAAATGLGTIFGLPYSIAFAIMVALPAWRLGHLALLGRPTDNGLPSGNDASSAASNLEWYPVGRILLWISGFAALITMAALLTLGTDAKAITDTLRQGLQQIIRRDVAPTGDTGPLIDALVTTAPAAATIVTMTTLIINLWLSARITAISGRLHRPWPDLKSTVLPPMTLAALCLAIAACCTDGLIAILAQIVAAALVTIYALAGFAVLHTLTTTSKSRVFWLGSTYTIVVVFIWPLVAMAALGLADAVFGIRQRYLRSRPPPVPVS